MGQKYNPVVVHYSANKSQKTSNCRYFESYSYIEDNQDVVWLNSKQYSALFEKTRSVDHKNKLLAIVRLVYKNRVIRRRYKCNQSLCLNNKQIGLTSESVRILFDDMPDISKEEINVSKGSIWDVFMYYWDHPFHATRISFKVGILSMILGIVSLIIGIFSLIC